MLATNGDTHLGRRRHRSPARRACRSQSRAGFACGSRSAIREGPDAAAVQQIRKAVIQAKWDLSDAEEAEIRVEPLPGVPGGYRQRITRHGVRASDSAARRPHARAVPAGAGRCGSRARATSTKPCSSAARRGFRSCAASSAELFGRQPHSELNPDEVVALGAAVQADILVSGRREMLLLDVTPLSLGIETMGGVVSKIILRNSTIPASGREMFTTGVDNQTGVDIHVLQGERELAADCRSLAHLHLRGIPPMPAGLPRIEVRFQIDANGILSVAARELRTGIEQTIEVKPSYGLTDQEVERMLIESFEHAEADFEARLLIDARNEAESVIQATEKVAAPAGFRRHRRGAARTRRARTHRRRARRP